MATGVCVGGADAGVAVSAVDDVASAAKALVWCGAAEYPGCVFVSG